jgi:type IV pilus assembly protein PilQ
VPQRMRKPRHCTLSAAFICAAMLVGQACLADGQAPVARVVRLPNTATLSITDGSGRVKTVQAALPRPRLALRQDRNDDQPTPAAPGLRWLTPQNGNRAQEQLGPQEEGPQDEEGQHEEIPSPDGNMRIPLVQPDDAGQVEVTTSGKLVSLVAREASLNSLLTVLAEHTGLNIVLTDATNAQVTITLKDVRLEDALDSILAITGNTWTRKNNIILVSNISNAGSLSTGVQGTVMRVFTLDYASAADVSEAVAALLSPMGRSFINQMDKADNHKTKEMVVVEDLPYVVSQIESYIRQIDTPPRQVMIQAHILKIDLKRTDLHGVNLNRIFSLLGHQLQFQTLGFANANDTTGFFSSFNGNEMGALIECLQSVSDAKTLAQPKVLCLNGQEASFQVGQKLGYRLISTSQTSTLQSINFLNVGVILHVTPRISRDDQIMMEIKPEVSDGSVDQTSGLPSSNTTTVETDVLLGNGRGIVIGGLIQESDTANISKIPVLGDIWLFGRLFQKRNIVRERAEVVIFLLPRIVPYDADFQAQTESEMARAQMPLLGDQFARQRRPGEAQLYDAVENPRPFLPRNQSQPAAAPSRSMMRRVTSLFSPRPKANVENTDAPAVERREPPLLAKNPPPPMPPRNLPPAPPVNPSTAPPALNTTAKFPANLSPRRLFPQTTTASNVNDAAPPQIRRAGDPVGTDIVSPPPLKSKLPWANNPNSGTLLR